MLPSPERNTEPPRHKIKVGERGESFLGLKHARAELRRTAELSTCYTRPVRARDKKAAGIESQHYMHDPDGLFSEAVRGKT